MSRPKGRGVGHDRRFYASLEMSQRWCYRVMQDKTREQQVEWRAVLAVRDDSGLAQAAADEEVYLGAQRMAHVREAWAVIIERLPDLQREDAADRRADYKRSLKRHHQLEKEDAASRLAAKALEAQFSRGLRAERAVKEARQAEENAASTKLAKKMAADFAAEDALLEPLSPRPKRAKRSRAPAASGTATACTMCWHTSTACTCTSGSGSGSEPEPECQ